MCNEIVYTCLIGQDLQFYSIQEISQKKTKPAIDRTQDGETQMSSDLKDNERGKSRGNSAKFNN